MIQYEELPTFGQITESYDDLFYVDQGLGKFKNGEFSEIIDEIKILPINSDPTSVDGDFDGLTDFQEKTIKTNPLKSDTDADGLCDGEEVEIGTSPLQYDTDGDGLNDGFEVELWYNPLNENPDGDYLNDKEEYLKGTSPFQYDKNWIDYTVDFVVGFFSGDFYQDSTSIPLLAGQITSSVIPVVGTVADVRDVAGNLYHGEYAMAGLSALGIVPLAGDITKSAAKVGKVVVKNIDNVPFVVGLIITATKINPDLAVAMVKNDDTLFAIKKVIAAPKGKVTKAEFDELSLFAKNADELITVLKYQPTSGVKLQTTPGKTTTVLGTFRKDTESILLELGNVKSTDFGPRVDGFNLLNTPNKLNKNPQQFWDEYNKPWLDNVIERDDVVLLATKPIENNLYKNISTKELTGFGREYTYLLENGYIFDEVNMRMIKNK